MTSFDKVFDRFLSKIEDVELAKMGENDRWNMLVGWLETGLSYIELDKLKIENDLSELTETEDGFVADLTNAEIEGVALYMMVAWYESKVNSLDHTLLFMGSKDEKWTNQRDHWRVTKEMQELYRKRARKYFRNHSSRDNVYINPDKENVEAVSATDTEDITSDEMSGG